MARKIVLRDPYRWSKLWDQITTGLRRKVRGRIFQAIESGDDDEVLRLATPRTLRKAVGEFGQSPLVAAIQSGRSNLAVALVARGGSHAGDGALASAALNGDLTAVDALLKAGKNPDEPLKGMDDTHAGYTPLMWAVNRKHLPVAKRLLAAGADVNAVAKDGNTAIMFTANGGPEELLVLDVLCAYQPDIHRKDGRGRSLVHEARDRERNSGRPEMRQLLERHFPGIEFNPR